MIYRDRIDLQTQGNADMHDLTRNVQQIVSEGGILDGIITIFTPSATSALTTIEYEEGALADLRRAFDQIAPIDQEYQHNLRWGDGNGHSHLRAALLGPSLSIPIVGGELTLGTWQQVLFVDFDVHARSRSLQVMIVGD